ncbi:hypothetical protein EMPS_11117 [Entomortierella parvispora]|uniref:Carboxylesterase type B domain-containing protein n=1 Tax=Entomortierella parvispora TaxID=205924 RepID=A0A9P3M1X5_9FUNG|nr:hypothetical protein EMPS_11117 [Entomortierella parvispora]
MATIEVNIANYGTLLGSVDEERQVAVFKNVPYAVVPKRWRPAVKVQPWSGVRDATKQGPVCPQMDSKYPLAQILPEEELKVGDGKNAFGLDFDEHQCLNLNIFVPLDSLKEGAKPVPVMSWVHGGACRDGSNGTPLYDARNVVKRSIQLNQPVIVVALNYRLNVFGFLASKELEEELQEEIASSSEPVPEYDQSVGNWGLMDQKMAFEWVRENISAFGGNARNVTAFGESAGSITIHYHMLCPSHFGLFDHAIMQSGTIHTMRPGHANTDGQAIFDGLLKKLNIPSDLDAKEKVRRLRAIPEDEITLAGSEFSIPGYQPYYDNGKIVPSKISLQLLALDPAAYDPNLKSVLIGANKNEGSAFASMFGELNLTNWPTLHQRYCPAPELNPVFEAVYGVPNTDKDVVRISADWMGDYLFGFPVQRVNQAFMALQKQKPESFQVTRYHFDAEIQKLKDMFPGLGALHAGELPFVFGPPLVETALTEKELSLSAEMQRIWIAFANQAPLAVEDGQVPKTNEALIWTAGHGLEIGESTRFSEHGLLFWDKVAGLLAQKDQALLLQREK